MIALGDLEGAADDLVFLIILVPGFLLALLCFTFAFLFLCFQHRQLEGGEHFLFLLVHRHIDVFLGGSILALLGLRFGQQILHREVDLTLAAVDFQHLDLDFLSFLHHVAGMLDVAMRHLFHVHHAFVADTDIHESAVVGDTGHGAGQHFAHLQIADGAGAGRQQREADAIMFLVQCLDPGCHLVTNAEHILGRFDPALTHLGDMHQGIGADTDIHKGAKIGEAFHPPLHFLTDGQFTHDTFFGQDLDFRVFIVLSVVVLIRHVKNSFDDFFFQFPRRRPPGRTINCTRKVSRRAFGEQQSYNF